MSLLVEDKKEKEHRILSASATFQKGLYHLFVISTIKPYDAFDGALRIYQSVFLLVITQMLLDFKFTINYKLRFADKDPAAGIQQNMIKIWSGFESGHPLYEVSKNSKNILDRIIDVRNNLIYRPFYLNANSFWYWEDCTLKELLQNIPTIKDVEKIYKLFFEAMEIWQSETTVEEQRWIPFFDLFMFQNFDNSKKTLLSSYSLLLNPNHSKQEEKIKAFIIKLFGEKIRKRL